MKKLLYITSLALLGLTGFARADVNNVSLTPATQTAISGSLVTFTITGTNQTGDAYLEYILPNTSSYDVVYQNSSIAPINTALLSMGAQHNPIFSLPAHSTFSLTITAKVTTNNRGFTPLSTSAKFASDMQMTNVLTSAVAQILPISDLMITNTSSNEMPSFSGDTIIYTLSIKNIGSTPATGMTLVSTFPIPMFTLPIARFDTIVHGYTSINYPQDLVWSGNYLNNLNPGETMFITLTTSMTQNFAVGTTFNQIAKVTTASTEYTTGNNFATATGVVQAPADVWVTKTLAPFTGYKPGDQAIYTITYGNSGGKAATNVVITDIVPTGISIPTTTFTINSLPAGSGGSFVVTGTLGAMYTSGWVFANRVNITTPDDEATTGNNFAIATGTVVGVANVSLNIIANNLSKPHLDTLPYGSGSDSLIQAMSGDIIQLTITYANFGNTPANSGTIQLMGTQGLSQISAYNGTIGTLPLNTTGTIVITGIVGPKNYISLTPTVTLTYNTNQTRIDSVIIQEPMICGDGVLTRTETCDTQGNIGVLFDGQVCENQQGMCVLVTKTITNNACINYQYPNPLGGVITGQSCSSTNTALTNAGCAGMTGSAPVSTTNGYEINFTCRANDATATTPISIDCGNGTTLAGTGNMLNGTCSYATGTVGNNAQCRVGADVNNAACRLPIAANQLQCDLEALDGRVVLVDENGDGEGRFRCETRDAATAQSIKIDCGVDGTSDQGGRYASATNTSQLETVCSYEENTPPANSLVTCSTNDLICETENIIVDESVLGYCGDGVREGFEDCDDGDENGNSDSNCTNGCNLKNNNGAGMVGCFSIGNNNISIQKGEFLPFRWNIENQKNIVAGNSCDGKASGSIPRESIMCTFSVYNGDNTQEDEDPLYTITKKCNEDSRGTSPLFSYFTNQQNQLWSLKNAFGKYFVDSNDFGSTTYGEYKIVLEKVEYDYCRDDEKDEGTQIDRVCSVNFTMTQPYLAQKSSFGLTPKSTNISLDGYKTLDGEELIRATDLEDIMVLDQSDYAGGSKVQTLMNSFIAKYEKLAITVPTTSLKGTAFEGLDIVVKVVPSQKIYILSSPAKKTITLKNIKAFTSPFTIVTKNIDLVIKGNVNYNGMFLVKDGTIAFEKSDEVVGGNRCTTPQAVKGIFVTNDGFVSTETLANNDTNKQRCNYGGLYVKGILIGDDIQNIVESKRSQLNHWFTVGGTSDAAIKAERRNEIFNGASVLIEYSPSLWSALPPGASEFTKVLDVYKQ